MKNPAPKTHPRDHFSYSQYSVFRSSPRSYILKYVYGGDYTNPALLLGKRVADMTETDEEQDDPVLETVRIFMPVYPKTKKEDCRIEQLFRGIKLVGIPDGLDDTNPARIRIGEYKTSHCWTQEKADKSEQLDWYALLVHLKYGVRPEDVEFTLHQIPTDGNWANPQLTGEPVENFPTKRTMEDVLRVGGRIVQTWREIGKACEAEYRSIGLA